MLNIRINKGQMLLELLIAIGLSTILIPILMISLISSRDGKSREINQSQAVALLKETEEAVKAIKNRGWSSLPPSSVDPYHPVISNNLWTLVAGASTSAGLTQAVYISDVNRDTSGNIVPSGGTLDPSTKKITSTISWTRPNPNSLTSTLYMTRTENITQTQTTYDEFNLGILDHVQLANVSGGEVKLTYNDKAKWCSPSISEFNIPLPDPPVAVAATASAYTHIPNDVFVATSPESDSVVKLAYMNVTANQATPQATLRGKFTMASSEYTGGTYPSVLGNPPTIPDLTNSFKTNDVAFYKKSDGKVYALLATDLPDKEVVVAQIKDISGDAYQDTTNQIYKYHSFFNTRIYAGSPAVVQNLNTTNKSPTSNQAANNNGFESNPDNAESNDGNYATDNNSGGTDSSTNCSSSGKDRHIYGGYDFNIPAGSTITGIVVTLDARVNSTSGSPDPKMCVQLSWDGGNSWSSYDESTLSTSFSNETFGGSADTWGHTWNISELSSSNFKIRITNVSYDNTRDFYLDWAAVNVYYTQTDSTYYDQAPFGYGASSIAVLNDRGYVTSGGYLYVFDLSNIDSKSPTDGLDMLGCRLELNGYDCRPGSPNSDADKYTSGQSGSTWSDQKNGIHGDCSDGGNIELFATNDIFPVKVSNDTYVYVAIGGVTNPEFEIIKVTTPPTGSDLTGPTCGRGNSTNDLWSHANTSIDRGIIDFNGGYGTEEAANSVFANSDGSRAYISSNGGDAKQFYILNTEDKNNPKFISGALTPTPANGFYYGSAVTPSPAGPIYHNQDLYVRSSLTVLNGDRAVLVGKDGGTAGNAQEYQVIKMNSGGSEASPQYCGGIDYIDGFVGLTSVSEKDGDNFVYMVGDTTNNELKIIQGGIDEGIYMSNGFFVSDPIIASSSTMFNRFVANIENPTDTTIKMQVAAAPLAGSVCPTDPNVYTFIGPAGDPALDANGLPLDFYSSVGSSISGAIKFGTISPNYANPNRCFRYKAWFSADDNSNSPQLLDFTLNYAP